MANARVRGLVMLMSALLIALVCSVAAQSMLRFNMVQVDGGTALR